MSGDCSYLLVHQPFARSNRGCARMRSRDWTGNIYFATFRSTTTHPSIHVIWLLKAIVAIHCCRDFSPARPLRVSRY